MKIREFHTELWLPLPPEELFPFFADAEMIVQTRKRFIKSIALLLTPLAALHAAEVHSALDAQAFIPSTRSCPACQSLFF